MNTNEPVDRRALMTEMFENVSYVNDYAGQPLPVIEDEDDDGDPIEIAPTE